MSQHECLVVSIKLEPHPDADSLSLVKVFGFQCVVRTDDWHDGDLAAYIPPDSLVPDTDEFQFLKINGKHWNRVRVRRLRGQISMGLLIPSPEGAAVGDNVMERMGISHYEPFISAHTGGDNERGPDGWHPKYDVENFRRFNNIFRDDEYVVATEKIHGSSAKFVWSNNRLYVGSRTNWKKEDARNLWWQAVAQNPWIEEWCRSHPDLTLYGEVFGMVKHFGYGTEPGQIAFAAFDIWDKDHWLDYLAACQLKDNAIFVPELYRGKFDKQLLLGISEGRSTVSGANHIREGTVVKPLTERIDPEIGRVQLKIVSNQYLSKDFT